MMPRPEAWYRVKSDYITLLHVPYSIWHLSYIVLGASLAPVIHWDRLLGALLAFTLGLVIGGHFLDELRGHPLGTRIPDRTLWAVSVASIMGAIMMGAWGVLAIGWGLVPFIAFAVFIVFAYNLESFGGFFHNIFFFSLAWGSLPAMVGYYASAVSITPVGVLAAATCYLLSVVQRRLSLPIRRVRRKAERVQGRILYKDGSVEEIDEEGLIVAPEAGLKWLSVSMPLLAATLLLYRVIG